MNKSESKYFNTATLMDEALLYLLDKKDFEYITVKEICKKAGVNRSTFYLHYESINDLLAESIEMINKRFISSFSDQSEKLKHIENATKEDVILITPEYLTPYLEFIKENKRIFKTIHSNPKLFEVEKTFNKFYKEIFEPALKKFTIPKEEEPYIFEFFTQGILAVIMKWVSLDCKEPAEHVQKLIINCVDANNRLQGEKNVKIKNQRIVEQ